MFSNHFITNFSQNAQVKKFPKSVNIWQRYGQNFVAYFFGPPCTNNGQKDDLIAQRPSLHVGQSLKVKCHRLAVLCSIVYILQTVSAQFINN